MPHNGAIVTLPNGCQSIQQEAALQSESSRFGYQSDQLQVGPAATQSEGIRFGSHFVNPQQFSTALQSAT